MVATTATVKGEMVGWGEGWGSREVSSMNVLDRKIYAATVRGRSFLMDSAQRPSRKINGMTRTRRSQSNATVVNV